MILTLRKDNAERWGIVEKHNVYEYKGITNVTHIFNLFSEPKVYKGGFFQSLTNIDESVGTEGYIRAKKPFYSMLDKSSCLVELKAKYQAEELIATELFLLKPLAMNGKELITQRISQNIPLPNHLISILKTCITDRAKFLDGRKEVYNNDSNIKATDI